MLGGRPVMQRERLIRAICTAVVFALYLAGREIGAAQEQPQVEELTVKPVKQRISDEAIETDKTVFKHLRTKLGEAKEKDIPEQTCAIAKAETWLADRCGGRVRRERGRGHRRRHTP
jgi:hypothetical protein